MVGNEGNKNRNSIPIKKIDKSCISGLTKRKKALLKRHMGSTTVKIDLNHVREWWKYENN